MARKLGKAVATALMVLAPRLVLAAPAEMVAGSRWSPSLLSIPLVAGILNFVTNNLAVKMMFYPLRFRGIGPIGWQGIVPNKSRKMARKIVDDVMLRLINMQDVMSRLPPDQVALGLDELILRLGNELLIELQTSGDRPLTRFAADCALQNAAFNATLLTEGRQLVEEIVRGVQSRVDDVLDLRNLVTKGMCRDSRVLVDLFERCGEKDLKFVVRSGFWLGGALGVLQMLLWTVWSPWWSLALTGGFVGLVTDQLALNLIFLPVEPSTVAGFTVHGLFLRRQAEVSAEFSEFMAAEVLSPAQLWDELLQGEKSLEFDRLVCEKVDAFLEERSVGAVLLGDAQWSELRSKLSQRLLKLLPEYTPRLYELTERSLALEELMRTKMALLTSEEFEKVLHPVFEEDEWILILIGTLLGALAGLGQAALGI